METQLIEALQNTIKAQNELIAYLKLEVERLKGPQLVFTPPTPAPQPFPQPYSPASPFQPIPPYQDRWWQTPFIVTSGNSDTFWYDPTVSNGTVMSPKRV
jgi:hypothetical protein